MRLLLLLLLLVPFAAAIQDVEVVVIGCRYHWHLCG